MFSRLCRTLPVLPFLLTLPLPAAEAEQWVLTLKQRIRAQEAIQRVYHAHQVGGSSAFDETVTGEVLEANVRRYLKKSVALEVYWNAPVSGEALSRELQRIARETRFPERLEQIFRALDHDPLLIQECLARPSLVERLSYEWYSREPLAAGKDWSHWWKSVEPSLDERSVRVADGLARDLPPIRGGPSLAPAHAEGDCNAWDNGALEDVPQNASGHTAVWTGSRLLVYGGTLGYAGWRYDPLLDDWSPMARPPIEFHLKQDYYSAWFPAEHTAIWTGTEMIVWGNTKEPMGARYEPLSDSWTVMSTHNALDPRNDHTAVWTGEEMIVWGGEHSTNHDALGNGASYHLATDTWTPISQAGAPLLARGGVAVWTGKEMLVWGGPYSQYSGRYNPQFDVWSPISLIDGPDGYRYSAAVWTGSEMLVWGGDNGVDPTSEGGRYDPATDVWTPISSSGAPEGREAHTAIWTGSEMIVWGGEGAGVNYLDNGGRYLPDRDSWVRLTIEGAPQGRRAHAAVWTGSEMIVWGGHRDYWQHIGDGEFICSIEGFVGGSRYDPETDQWTPINEDGAPSYRSGQSAIWTGSEMIIWGRCPHPVVDCHPFNSGNDGGRYDPQTDSWTPTSIDDAPSPRGWHSAVWTGSEMLVWGGELASDFGGAYDPSTDTWAVLATEGSPAPRRMHGGVWTGDEMLVWGGTFLDGGNSGTMTALSSGGSFGPREPALAAIDDVELGRPAPGVAHLSWTVVEGADSYAVIRGTASTLDTGYYGDCIHKGLPAPEFIDAEPPPAGNVFTYLVRGENPCRLGRFGPDSSGQPRVPQPEPEVCP